MILQAVVGGFVLDALFGDPAWLPHPVVLMGRCISRLEKFLRARLPGTPQGELLGGGIVAAVLPLASTLALWTATSSACIFCIVLSRTKSTTCVDMVLPSLVCVCLLYTSPSPRDRG